MSLKTSFRYKKSVQALNFFAIQEGGSINKMKAIKLIWLSDRLHLRKFARPIMNDQYWAMKNGPVPSVSKDIAEGSTFLSESEIKYRTRFLRKKSKYVIESIEECDWKVFSKSDMEVLKDVYAEFGKYDKFELSEISHSFPEWFRFETELNAGIVSRREIDIMDFFSNQVDLHFDSLNQTEELLQLSRDIYNDRIAHDYSSPSLCQPN